jgi:hypothetical protein
MSNGTKRARFNTTACVVAALGSILGACVYGLVRMEHRDREAARARIELHQIFDR